MNSSAVYCFRFLTSYLRRMSSMARWKASGWLSISANWTFPPALTVEALWADIGWNHGVRKGVGHFERQLWGEEGSSTNIFWRQKTRVSGLSRGVVCVILPTFSRFDTIPAGDRHNDGYYPRISSAARLKFWRIFAQWHNRPKYNRPIHQIRFPPGLLPESR